MVKVDVRDLKERLDFFSALLNQHEEATIDLFNTINHTSDFWKDNRAALFFNQIAEEKVNNRKFRNNLKKREQLYKYIYDQYSKFGYKIECDYKNKDAVLKKLDYGIEQLDIILKRFANLDLLFQFSEKDFLLEQKRRINNLKKEWQNYQNNIRKYLNQVESIELKIKNKINELEELKLKTFIFD